MTNDPKLRRRDIRTLLAYAGPFKVVSLANGWLRVEPSWQGQRRPIGCAPPIVRNADGDCVKCGVPHLPGFGGRMELAGRVEVLLNREARKVRGGRR